MFLGEDLLPWLVLALGSAMAAGNLLALLRPPEAKRNDDDLEQAPLLRGLAFMTLGTIAAVWALASLLN